MLEFQEGFFEQEVRDGFYLDVTIKTLWASEMELLNKVAEVCAKYDLKWYAAYGTLLGAIRHEGFVPWDDDMDIWMMRKDYNKLMKVLQDELPEGYRVRSPQTETGYDQFHTCVNNGSGISIAKDWLEANHNCPFTVGLDIFPLDYLPKDEKSRDLQKSIFILVGRVAQVAKNLNRGDYDQEDAIMSKEEAIGQVKEGLRYLKKNYKFSLDKRWIKDEEWDKVASEVWKWGNYVASMYGENESDYIVEYLDWARWSHKKFPKEWFSEQYGATFENSMIPIPSGYHELLYTIYGDYCHYTPKTGCHEYPYYARQLRQLREYVSEVETKAVNLGIVSIDDIKIDENFEMPDGWNKYLMDSNGVKKKTVLFANDLDEYYIETSEKLDELENTLEFFKSRKENIALIWRPQKSMVKHLLNIGKEYAERYSDILEHYKCEAWGICDEEGAPEYGAKYCDAYYGGMNAVIQQVQNYDKPVLIESSFFSYETNNSNRLLQSRCYICYTDYVICGEEKIWANTNYNAIYSQNICTGEVTLIDTFIGESRNAMNIHIKCVEVGGKICFLPVGNGVVHIYDSGTKLQKRIELGNWDEIPAKTWDYFYDGNDFYLVPCAGKQGLWRWSVTEDTFEQVDWWKIEVSGELSYGKIDDKSFYIFVKETNVIYITDMMSKQIVIKRIPAKDITEVYYSNGFWFQEEWSSNLFYWEGDTNKVSVLELPELDEYNPERDRAYYQGVYFVGDKVILIPQMVDKVYIADIHEGSQNTVLEVDKNQKTFSIAERKPFFKRVDGCIEVMCLNMNMRLCIDVNNNIAKVSDEVIVCGKEVEEYQYKVALDRKALLANNDGVIDRQILCNYLME